MLRMADGPTAATHVVAKYDYAPADRQELALRKGEKLLLLDDSRKWWRVENSQLQSGYVPSNFVKRCKPSLLASLRNTLGRRKSTPAAVVAATTTSSTASSSAQSSCCASPRSTTHRATADSLSVSSVTTSEATSEAGVAVVARYPYRARQSDELALTKGERVLVLEKSNDGWWRGRKPSTGETGWFPSNYMEPPADNDGGDAYATAPWRNSKDKVDKAASFIDSLTRVGDGSNYCGPSAGLSRANLCTMGTVVALYRFATSNPREELSFEKNERLEIIDKPAVDPEWWRARNARGEVGLIPRNYVQTLSADSGIQTGDARTTSESTSSGGLGGGGGFVAGGEASCAVGEKSGAPLEVRETTTGVSEATSGVLGVTSAMASGLSGATLAVPEATSVLLSEATPGVSGSTPGMSVTMLGASGATSGVSGAASGVSGDMPGVSGLTSAVLGTPSTACNPTSLVEGAVQSPGIFPPTASGFSTNVPSSAAEMSAALAGTSETFSGLISEARGAGREVQCEGVLNVPSSSSAAVGEVCEAIGAGAGTWGSGSKVEPLGSKVALPPVPRSAYAARDWFFSSITRAECERMLNGCADNGDFLIRESETNVGDYTLTLKAPHRNKHFRITVDRDSFGIGQQVFKTLDDLVAHYKKHPIYRHANERLYLIKAFERRAGEDRAIEPERPTFDVVVA